MESDDKPKPKPAPKPRIKIKIDRKWVLTAFIASLAITIVLTLLAGEVLEKLNIAISFIILVLFIIVNIVFDMIGLAVATAEEKQFHAMASRRIESAKTAIKMIRNADRISSLCSDVVGDIAGIVSGATAGAIILKLFTTRTSEMWGNLIITGLVAAVTVGGKAISKSVSMTFSNEIVEKIAYLLTIFKPIKGRKRH